MKKSLGERINAIRLEKGYTMEDFGKLFNTSKGTVNNWEKGRNNPNRKNLKKIAEIGNVSVEFLLYGSRDLLGNEMPVHELSLYNYEIIKTNTKRIAETNSLSMIILIKLFKGEDVQASFLNCRMISNYKYEITELHIDDIHYYDYIDLQPQDEKLSKVFFDKIKLKSLDDIVIFSKYRRLKRNVLNDFDKIFFTDLFNERIKKQIKDNPFFEKYSLDNNLKIYFIENDYKFKLINIDD